MEKKFLSESTAKRIVFDIKDVNNNLSSKDNIYYQHSDEDLLKGYALIIGPDDTPYAYGFFLFKFEFPYDYPHSPPKVTYCTNDGIIRFHPNLYINGK